MPPDVVHGDIKPDNVLVYTSHGNSKLAVTKLADFSFSHIKRTEDDRIRLPRSEPWCAPEWHHREHTIKQAQIMDVFSFGLLCFWVLFRNHLFNGLTYEQEMDRLQNLKAKGKLLTTASAQLELLGMTMKDHHALKSFFAGTLCRDPRDRIQRISASMPYLGRFTDGKNEDSITHSLSDHLNFRLATSIDQWYQMDFRVRQRLVQLLESTTKAKCPDCARNAVLQSALCYHLAFGTSRDPERAQQYLSQQDIDISVLIQEIDVIRKCRFPERPGQAKWYLEPDLINQYQERVDFEEAIRCHSEELITLQQCFDAAHPLVRMGKSTLAHILDGYGRTAEALDLCNKQYEEFKSLFDEDHEVMISTKSQMALFECKMGNISQAITIGERLLSICERSVQDTKRLTMTVLSNLVIAYSNYGNHEKAVSTSERLWELHDTHLGLDHPDTLLNLQNLAMSYTRQDPPRMQEALALQERTLKRWRLNFGQKHRSTIEATMVYAYILRRSEDRDEFSLKKNDTVLDLYKWAMEASMDQLSDNNPTTWVAMANYARMLPAYERFEEASVLLRRSVDNLGRLLPHNHHDYLDVQFLLAAACIKTGEHSEAESLLEEILRSHSSADPETQIAPQASAVELRAWYEFGHLCQRRNDNNSAREAWERALTTVPKDRGFHHSVARYTISHLGPLYIAEGQHDAGINLLTQLAVWCEEHLGNEDYATINAKQELGANFTEIGKFKEARDILHTVLSQAVSVFGKDDEQTLVVQGNLAFAMRCLGENDAARVMSEDVLVKRRATLGDAHEDTILSMRNLLRIYIAMQLWPEAQNLIKEISLAIEVTPLDDNAYQVFQCMVAEVDTGSGRLEEGEKRFRQELSKYPHYDTPKVGLVTAQYCLAWVLSDTKYLEEAADLARSSLEGREVLFGPYSWPVCQSAGLLGVILREHGKLEKAEQAFERELEVSQQQKDGLDKTDIVDAWEHLITVYKKQGRGGSVAKAQQSIKKLGS